MSDTYVNPDSPNPDVTAAAVAAMRAGGVNGYAAAPTTGYYPGGYADPFAVNNGGYSPDSRSNIGPAYPNYGAPPQVGYPYGQYGQTPPPQPVQSASPFNALAEQKNVYGGTCDPGWMNIGYGQTAQPQTQVMPYSGYPQGVTDNYIYDYMRGHTQSKITWGENYWTTPKPIDPPVIDWTPKPTQPVGYTGYVPPQDPYAGYGYGGYGSQPAPMPNFGFAPVEQSWYDKARSNWKNL